MSKENNFGYIEDTPENKSFGNFGLNQDCKVEKLTFDENEEYPNTVEFSVKVGDSTYKTFISDPEGRVYKDGELIDETDEEYEKTYNNLVKERLKILTHILKAATNITDEDLKKEFEKPAGSFREWVLRAFKNIKKINNVDVFLEYQYNIKEGYSMTFLQIPKNMKGGVFLTKATKDEWKEIKEKGLKYKNEKGETHPFVRNQNYMESPKANQKVIEEKVSETENNDEEW